MPNRSQTSGHVQSANANIAVVKRMIAAWEARDLEAIVGLFAADGILHSMMSAPLVGRAAIRAQVAFLLGGATWLELNVRTWAVSGDTVIIERIDAFTFHGHDGEVPVVGVLEIVGERVRAWRDYYDRAALLRAMGLGLST